MTDAERFYAERDRRTREYGVPVEVLEREVAVVVGADAAGSRAGQVAALALVNMLARIHRSVSVSVPIAALQAKALVEATDLRSAMLATARAINPFLRLEENIGPVAAGVPSVGLGSDAPGGLDCYIGAESAVAIVSDTPVSFNGSSIAVLGAGLASTLAAADLLRLVTAGVRPLPRRVSAWGFGEGNLAETGPANIGPVDVGDVLVVGAGAVGSSFVYWVRELGHSGKWVVVDGDSVELHNTNRALGLVAADAGWPAGEPAKKATRAAGLIGCERFPVWYDEWMKEHDADRPDIVLPLANDRGVRAFIGSRGEPILVHATTSSQNTAEFHRHILGRDECIDCRYPPNKEPDFTCATGPVEVSESTSVDAALPYLSGAAGLLLAAGLMQLSQPMMIERPHNHYRLHMPTGNRSWTRSIRRCAQSCVPRVTLDVARSVHSESRWVHLLGGPNSE